MLSNPMRRHDTATQLEPRLPLLCVLCTALCLRVAVCRAVYSAHMREKALEALLWFMQLPAARDRPGLLTPREMVQWMSTGEHGCCCPLAASLLWCTCTSFSHI
jgi:hypothetical protein